MERAIVEALKSVCGNKNIKYQVVIQDRGLHIYVNHHRNRQPHYSLLKERVSAAIASLSLDAIDRVWLYSRPFGTVTPNWQIELEIPQLEQIDSDEVDTIGTTRAQEATSLGVISQTGVGEASIQSQEDRIGDTGLFKDSGLIHGSPLQEEEIDTALTGSRKTANSDRGVSNSDLAQYCFIAHKKLLTGDIIFPEKEIVRSLEFFHHLGDRQRRELLPILEAYFQSAIAPDLDSLPLAVRKWFKQIDELDSEKRQMFAIWLSRYCFDPDTTIAELKTATPRNARSNRIAREYRPTEYSFTPSKTNSEDLAEEFARSSELNSGLSPSITKLLPIGWILATAILLVAIANNNTVSTSQIPAQCSKTIGSPEYCRLAVNLAGRNQIAPPDSFLPLTEVTEAVASYGCQRYANLKAGLNLDPKIASAISSYGEKVFPHLYVVRVVQKNARSNEHTAVGCVYTSGQNQRSPKLLAADVIPRNWPAESYQPQKVDLAFGKFSKPIKLGLYTLCAAGGIAIASRLNLGIEIESMSTVYLMALILGIVQLAISFVPVSGAFGTTLISISTLITLGFFLKDFKLHWHRNLIAVAVGIFSIIAIQFLFYGLCLEAIASLI